MCCTVLSAILARGENKLRLNMRVADCPKCGAPARPAGNTAYCPSCGWNRLAAVEAVRQSLLAQPIVFLTFFAFSLLTKRWIGVLAISGLVLVANAVSAVKLLQQKRELLKMGVSGLDWGSSPRQFTWESSGAGGWRFAENAFCVQARSHSAK